MVIYYISGLVILGSAVLIGLVFMTDEKKTETGYDPDTQTFPKIDKPRLNKAKETTYTQVANKLRKTARAANAAGAAAVVPPMPYMGGNLPALVVVPPFLGFVTS